MHSINGRTQMMVKKKHLATPLYTSPPIPEERKRRIQQIIGTFLYYARTVVYTMIPDLNTLAEEH